MFQYSYSKLRVAYNDAFRQLLHESRWRTYLDFFYLLDCLYDNGTKPDLSRSSLYF